MRKQPVIKLKCAQTFIFKSRCKFCKTGPKYIYFLMNRYIDDKNISAVIKYYNNNNQAPNKLSDNRYLESSIKNRTFRPTYMFDYDTMYFKKISPPNSKYEQEKDRFTSVLQCDCSATNWAFIDSRRKHIQNRKNAKAAPKLNINSLYKIML